MNNEPLTRNTLARLREMLTRSRLAGVPFVLTLTMLSISSGRPAYSQRLTGPIPFAVAQSKQWQRAQWAYSQRAYPLGYVPQDAKLHALQQIEAAPAALSAAMTGAKWKSLGPTPIANDLADPHADLIPLSGRVADVAVDPKKSKHWLIGAAQGGIWETRNAGKSWKARTDKQATLAMGAIAFAPSNPRIVYAGTGEAVFSGVAYGGTGILKSTTGGKSWKPIGQTNLNGLGFSDIAVDPMNSSILVAATVRTARGREFLAAPAGVYRSTDGAQSWSRTLSGQATDLEIHAKDFSRQFAAIGEIFGGAENGLYRSSDAGSSWTRVQGPWDNQAVGRMELALAPSNPDVLYVSVQDANTFGFLGLWTTQDASASGPTWKKIAVTPTNGRKNFCDPQCWYNQELSVDPADAGKLFAGGVVLWVLDGNKWKSVLPGHADQHAMAWAGQQLIVGNDGGVFSSKNAGGTWSSHNQKLTLTQYYHGAMHPTRLGFLLGGSQDNGTQVRINSNVWKRIAAGDGADIEISASQPDTHWAFSSQNLRILRTTDGGVTRTVVNRGIKTKTAPFIAVFSKCPGNDDVFIAGAKRLMRTDTFFKVASPRWKAQGPKLKGGDEITAVAFAPSDGKCMTYAFGTAKGKIFVTKNGGKKWTDADNQGDVPGRFITDLAFDPNNMDTLYAALSGFDEGTPGQPGHLFITGSATTGTPRWTDISPPVNLPHNAVAVQLGTPNKAWVGTDVGVWEQQVGQGSTTWIHHGPNVGMPNIAVFDIQATESGVVAFTHGRGAFSLGGKAAAGGSRE